MPRIGVLAIQGDFAAHMATLREAGAEVCEVRKAGRAASSRRLGDPWRREHHVT